MGAAQVLSAVVDRATIKTIQGALEQAHSVSIVNSSSLLLDSLRLGPPCEIVLLESELCSPNVEDVCQQIKAISANTSIILLAEAGISADTPQALDALADGYLTKPIDKLSLCAWINAAIRLRSLQAELSKRLPEAQSDKDALIEAFATLSHTVNNPLQALYATVDMLLLNYPDDEKIAALAETIFTHAEKVARAVTQASARAKQFLTL